MGQWPMDNTIGATNSLFLSQERENSAVMGVRQGFQRPNPVHKLPLHISLILEQWCCGYMVPDLADRAPGCSACPTGFQGFFALPK